MFPRPSRAAIVIVVTLLAPVAAGAQSNGALKDRMLLAEDGRAQTDAELSSLRQGLTSRDVAIRLQAVRAIGRLERPDLIPSLTRPLADENIEVRIEAANAVGQLARGPKGVADAKPRLLARAKIEADPRAWGAIAATLGRLPYTTADDVDQAEAVIARVLPAGDATAIQIDAVLGATEGLEGLARQSGKISKLKPATLDGLRAASKLQGRAQDADKLARIRRFATMALTASGAVLRPQLDAWMADEDAEVRRLGMVAARADIEGREDIVTKGLADPNPQVRFEALQTWGRVLQKISCEPIVAAVRDANAHVKLLAIDLLGNACPGPQPPIGALQALAETLTPGPGAWHAPAHAIVALAKTAPAEARKLLPRYATHQVWQVRMYAAHAAGPLAALDALDQLARDPNDNVREAALGELIVLKRPEAIPLAIDALTRFDYQLIITASRALGVPAARDRAVPALLQALERITAEKRETSRDARAAIVDRLKDLGWPNGAAAGDAAGDAATVLSPYLKDFDPAIAARVADLLSAWQKGPAIAAPQRLPRPAVSSSAVDGLRGSRLRFVMASRGLFELRLLVDEAPLTSLRVATRAREGYYNGLTFHRVAPNFVIQGGGPGANEYSGDGPFMRDEVGLPSHRRGTVGISTRGRDTGDAQIFVNLVDSPRLDHTYTVFAEVVTGMDVVDGIIEGDVIERVELVPGSR